MDEKTTSNQNEKMEVVMKVYTVYCHNNKINNKKYIGITCQKPKYRWGKDGHNYSLQTKFYNAILKYGWDNFDHIILEENLEEQEALKSEQKYIEKYNSISNGYNVSTGGGVGYCKQLICITTGKIYNSVAEAAQDVNVSSSSISHCLHGDQFTAGKIDGIKLEWRFIINSYNHEKDEKIKIKNDITQSQQQKQYEEALIYKEEYINNKMTITNIAKKYHVSKCTVTKRLKSLDVKVIPSQISRRKPVNMYDLNWNLIRSFETSTEALKFLNKTDSEISRLKAACTNQQKIYKGYHWKYAE